MSDLLTAFPDFPIPSLPAIPASWAPAYWRNDACPSWTVGPWQVFVDFPDDGDREWPGGERFSVHRTDSDFTDCRLCTDDWSAVLALVEG